jgi:hypothetical protein
VVRAAQSGRAARASGRTQRAASGMSQESGELSNGRINDSDEGAVV